MRIRLRLAFLCALPTALVAGPTLAQSAANTPPFIATGHQLFETCAGEASDPSKCVLFVHAVIGGYSVGRSSLGKPNEFCLTGGLRVFQLWASMKDFLVENPNVRELPPEDVVILAMRAKFPCED